MFERVEVRDELARSFLCEIMKFSYSQRFDPWIPVDEQTIADCKQRFKYELADIILRYIEVRSDIIEESGIKEVRFNFGLPYLTREGMRELVKEEYHSIIDKLGWEIMTKDDLLAMKENDIKSFKNLPWYRRVWKAFKKDF